MGGAGRATVVCGGWEGGAGEVAVDVVIDAADVEAVDGMEETVVGGGGGGVMGTAATSPGVAADGTAVGEAVLRVGTCV